MEFCHLALGKRGKFDTINAVNANVCTRVEGREMKKQVYILLTGVALVLGTGMGSISTASEPASQVFVYDEDGFVSADTLLQFVEYYADGTPRGFNSDDAKAAGLSEQNIKVGETLNDYLIAEYDPYSRIHIAYHGNWCGPSHTNLGPPIDVLDEICMHHDKCYDNHSNNRCDCDLEFIREIDVRWRELSFGLKIKAKAAQALIKIHSMYETCGSGLSS